MYVLVGRFCPTDADPATDEIGDVQAFAFNTLKEAQDWPGGFWYPNADIIEVTPPPDTPAED